MGTDNWSLGKGFSYLIEKMYDGNTTEMERQTGVSRGIISQAISGEKDGVHSSTLVKMYEAGFNVNWLLTGKEQPFNFTDQGRENVEEITDFRVSNNRQVKMRQLAEELLTSLDEDPSLILDRDLQRLILQLLQSSVR